MSAYRRVTYDDRCHISAYLKIKLTRSEIAKRTGFDKSTIGRELKRNLSERGYKSEEAQELSRVRFRNCRKKFKIVGPVEQLVISKIMAGWSPEQVCGRLYKEKRQRISHTTIYNYIHRYHLKNEPLRKALRKFNKRGVGRLHRGKNRPDWMLTIHDRPKIIDKRTRLGDWERDTMFGMNRKRLIVCLERKSRFTKIAKVTEPYCLTLTDQTKNILKSTGKLLSITNDNGSEFKDGYQFGVPVYYCDARSPHQRGSVENQIGLIRQYVSRKTDLDQITESEVQSIEDRLNNRPRKCLDYKTPYEVFYGKSVALAN